MEAVNCPPEPQDDFSCTPPHSGLPDPESNFAQAGGLIHLAEVMGKGSEGLVMAPGNQGLEYLELLGGKLLGDEAQPYKKKGIVMAQSLTDRRGRASSEVVSFP